MKKNLQKMLSFRRTISSETDNQLLYYVNGAKCDSESGLNYEVIIIQPGEVTSIDERIIGPPHRFELCQNYPNPFNPKTTIVYSLERTGRVELKIYNTLGKLIRTMVARDQPAGEYSIMWDGRDDPGKKVASGNYFVTYKAGDFQSARKVILLQ
ncbi:T9SS type A sorting domain-containing protein [bacterium]|nr:T9SS type A sorting domain-containing protein [bacterium]